MCSLLVPVYLLIDASDRMTRKKTACDHFYISGESRLSVCLCVHEIVFEIYELNVYMLSVVNFSFFWRGTWNRNCIG